MFAASEHRSGAPSCSDAEIALINRRVLRGVVEMDDQENRYIPRPRRCFRAPASEFANRLKGQGPIKIVAIGSSSTAGEGDIVPYTYRLQTSLRDQIQEPHDRRA